MQTTDNSLHFAEPDEQTPDWYPHFQSISGAWFFRFLPVPNGPPTPPEMIYIEAADCLMPREKVALKTLNTIAQWNASWEAGGYACHVQDKKRIPRHLRWLLKAEGRNVRLLPRRSRDRYSAYAPLFHLLPLRLLQAHGLPILKRGQWPYMMNHIESAGILPTRFDEKLAQAFSAHVWPLLCSGSKRKAFSAAEPLMMLSHNLDFWLPYADVVAQNRARALGRVRPERDDVQLMEDINADNREVDAAVVKPSMGGSLWMGEDDAWDATKELVSAADQYGRLAGIVDAIRSHRVQDDFSSQWSFAREDFERRLFHKRLKVKVSFVELPDTIPVHGRDSELHESMVWEDFFTLLDRKERRIAVCLRSGSTSLSDIATHLGYANHSPVSKALKKIREKAKRHFGMN
jgi:hypothetical protein